MPDEKDDGPFSTEKSTWDDSLPLDQQTIRMPALIACTTLSVREIGALTLLLAGGYYASDGEQCQKHMTDKIFATEGVLEACDSLVIKGVYDAKVVIDPEGLPYVKTVVDFRGVQIGSDFDDTAHAG